MERLISVITISQILSPSSSNFTHSLVPVPGKNPHDSELFAENHGGENPTHAQGLHWQQYGVTVASGCTKL